MAEAKPIPNQKLRHERERRAWSQQEVADKVGTTPLNVGRWERGITSPGPYFRQKLCEVFEKTPQALGLVHKNAEAETPIEVPISAPSTAPAQEAPARYGMCRTTATPSLPDVKRSSGRYVWH